MMNWFKRDNLTKFEREIIANVDQHGCHMNGVFDPDGDDPTFVYSVGFTKTLEKIGKQNFPEVIILGLPGDFCAPAINQLLAMCAAGQDIAEGERLERFFGDFDGIVRMVHPSQIDEDYFNSAIWFHRTQMDRELKEVAMLVWPDAKGLYPWEQGCEEWVREDQPALYEPRLNS